MNRSLHPCRGTYRLLNQLKGIFMQIELKTMNEAQVLMSLIDLAVKSGGLQAAEAGVHFSKILKAAMDAEAASAESPAA